MKKPYLLLFLASLGFALQSNAQFAYQESFTGQSNFGNPTGWDNIDGFTTWNVYPNHGNPAYGLTRSFQVGQSDSIATSSSTFINVALGAQLKVDARVMAFSLYPSSSATLPAGASLSIQAFDGLGATTIISMTSANQNQDTGWVTLTGSLNLFAGSQIQLRIVGKNGPNGPADYFIDLDNFSVTDGPVGMSEATATEISFFPNPSNDFINVKGLNGKAVITISDVLGNTVKNIETQNSKEVAVDIHAMKTGIYLVNVKSEGTNFTQKLIKN